VIDRVKKGGVGGRGCFDVIGRAEEGRALL